jgi:transcriptional regulator with XRE-family HTH domain
MSPADIRRVRKALRLTQEQFAQRLGISFATVNRWETDKSRPQRANIAAIERMMLKIERYDLDALRAATRDLDFAITEWFRLRDGTEPARPYARTRLENAIAAMETLLGVGA